MNHLPLSACSGLMSLHPVASGQLPGCGSQEVPPLASHKGPLEAWPCYPHSFIWLVWLFTAHGPGGVGHPYPASLSKVFRTLSHTGAPPFLCTEHCFLALELGHSGVKGVDTFFPPSSFHRDLQTSHPLTEQPDRSHCWVGQWQRWVQAKYDSLIGSVPIGRVHTWFRAFSTKT